MKRVEVELAVNKFDKALKKLKEACEIAVDDLYKDGVIQRFEFAVELLWKTLKIILEFNQINCHSPRDCIKKSFRGNIFKNKNCLCKSN